jgi:hypothetical protein
MLTSSVEAMPLFPCATYLVLVPDAYVGVYIYIMATHLYQEFISVVILLFMISISIWCQSCACISQSQNSSKALFATGIKVKASLYRHQDGRLY